MQRRNNPNQRKEKIPMAVLKAVLTKKSVLIETVEFAKPQCVACESHVYPFGLPALLRASLFPNSAALQAEILALRHQLLVLQRSSRGHKLRLSSLTEFSGSGYHTCGRNGDPP